MREAREKYLAIGEYVFFAFMNLEKEYDAIDRWSMTEWDGKVESSKVDYVEL